MKESLIELKDITKVYQMGQVEVHAVRGISQWIKTCEIVAIMGPSGSGKSTLVNILGCLDQPTSGQYLLDQQDVSRLNENQLAEILTRKLGFVFQTFNMLGRTTALQNVALPLIYAGVGGAERRRRAQESLEAVGLADRVNHKPMELSGGQQQRVAIARSLVNNLSIILADEPTGNLDSKSGVEVMAILQSLNQEWGITFVVVTHSHRIARLPAVSFICRMAASPIRRSCRSLPAPRDRAMRQTQPGSNAGLESYNGERESYV